MSGGNEARVNIPTALIEFRLRLTADKLPEGRKNPNLEVSVNKKNEIQISCNTGIFGADNAQVRIQGNLGLMDFSVLQTYAEQIHAQAPGHKYPLIRLYGPRKKRTPQDAGKGLDAVVLVGKDANGVCYMSVMRKDAPQVKFIFQPGRWVELADATTQQPLSQADISNLYSQAWAKTFAPLVTYALNVKVYDFREDNQQGGGNNYQGGNNGGGNNYNRGGNGGGNNNYNGGGQQQQQAPAPAADFNGFDDDIPL